jgi:hypothetical protein
MQQSRGHFGRTSITSISNKPVLSDDSLRINVLWIVDADVSVRLTARPGDPGSACESVGLV